MKLKMPWTILKELRGRIGAIEAEIGKKDEPHYGYRSLYWTAFFGCDFPKNDIHARLKNIEENIALIIKCLDIEKTTTESKTCFRKVTKKAK